MLTLWRHEESDPFTTAETELMGSLSQPLGASVRRAVRESLAASVGGGEPPGVLTFDQDGCLLSLNAHAGADRKSTRLNSSHVSISYAVFCLKKKKHK